MNSLVDVKITGNIGWVMVDNPPVNATSTAVRAGLLAAVTQVQGCQISVLQCAGRTFIAGGDMSEFDSPPQEPHLPDVVDAIEQSKVPFVALLHGTVLGGGFEIAMACAFRVAKPGTRFGLPEVNVGLVPGAGGTQRAPRLLGWDASVDMACLGKMVSAEELLAVGAIDRISEAPEAIVDDFVGQAAVPVSQRAFVGPSAEAIATAETKALRFAKGRQAPLHNLRALQWAMTSFAEGQPKERALHLELRHSEESKALRHVFFAEREVTQPSVIKGVSPKTLQKIAIVGGGLMGCGIAAACLNGGYVVTVIERDGAAVENARVRVEALMLGALERGKISKAQFETRMAGFHVTEHYSDAGDADLAIEAVFEDLAAKQSVFASLADVMRPDAILATNTSYLDPNEIFRGTPRLERCLGIHFFSPAHIMKLVEVVQAAHTDQSSLATAFALVKGLRKTGVLAGVCDGFIGNRILAAYRRAAEYMLADGALPAQIDGAMRGFGMAMGPFEAQDQSGLQIAEANRRRLDALRDPNERYVDISDQLCARGRYGRRSSKGWYDYDGKTGTPSDEVEQLILVHSAETGIARRSFTDEEIVTRLLTVMANEGAQILDEGIAEAAAAIDVVYTSGYGFPRWRGGPMHWAEQVGQETVLAALDQLEADSPGSWLRAAKFQKLK